MPGRAAAGGPPSTLKIAKRLQGLGFGAEDLDLGWFRVQDLRFKGLGLMFREFRV